MCASGGGAIFPINVVIKNTEDAIKIEPKNYENYLILSQAYSIASVLEEVEVQQSQGKIDSLGGACGGGPSIIFWNNTGKKNSNTAEYLKKSIESYTIAIKRNPDDGRLYLGRGWAYLQLGDKKKARKDFIHSIDKVKANKEESKNESKWILTKSKYDEQGVLVESVEYLKPLLNPKKDSVLIKKITSIENDPIFSNPWAEALR